MMTYTLPDFTVLLGLNLFFVQLLERRPALFQDGVRIGSVYGSFPGCVLNGGRAYLRERTSPAQMEETFSLLAAHGVKPRLTLTNMLATEDDLHDGYLNEMLAAAARHGGEAIVYADFVADYVRERYGLRCVLSTTRPLADAAEVNRMTKRYDYVVLDYNRHKDSAFLAAIEDCGKAIRISILPARLPASSGALPAQQRGPARGRPAPLRVRCEAPPLSSTMRRATRSFSLTRRCAHCAMLTASRTSKSSAAACPSNRAGSLRLLSCAPRIPRGCETPGHALDRVVRRGCFACSKRARNVASGFLVSRKRLVWSFLPEQGQWLGGRGPHASAERLIDDERVRVRHVAELKPFHEPYEAEIVDELPEQLVCV